MVTIAATNETLTEAEWLAARRHGIGASEAPAALGLDEYRSPLELWARKLGKIPDDPESEAAYWGKQHEPAILRRWERETRNKIVDTQVLVWHPEYPFFATLDAVDDEGGIVECKSINERRAARVLGESGTDEVPETWYVQAQHQMLCHGAEAVSFAVLVGGNQFRQFVVWRSEAAIAAMVPKLLEFWRHVQSGEPPSFLNAAPDVVRALFPPRPDAYEAGELERSAADLLMSLRAHKGETEKQIRQVEADLLALTQGRQALLPDGRRVEYRTVERKGYTVEPGSYQVLRISKARDAS
jgi:putative phage-type endonuclease